MVTVNSFGLSSWGGEHLPLEPNLRWNIGTLSCALHATQDDPSLRGHFPSPRKVASLIESGDYGRAVSLLGWILSERDIGQFVHTSSLPSVSNSNDLLRHIYEGRDDLQLLPEQRAVANMIYAIRVIGLDSDVHAGDRAISLLKQFQKKFVDIPNSVRHGQSPVVAAASLIAAQGSRHEHAQPTGILVLKEAVHSQVPAVLVTTNHTLGGDSVFLIAHSIACGGLLNGRIDSSDTWIPFHDTCADIFYESRKDIDGVWVKAFDRLLAKGLADGDKILVVEDCHSGNFHPDDPEAVCAPIRRAFASCSQLAGYSLVWAKDSHEGVEALTQGNVAGVVTDLFMPWITGSQSKAAGDKLVQDILRPYLSESEVTHLLSTMRGIDQEVGQIVRSEFDKLIIVPPALEV